MYRFLSLYQEVAADPEHYIRFDSKIQKQWQAQAAQTEPHQSLSFFPYDGDMILAIFFHLTDSTFETSKKLLPQS